MTSSPIAHSPGANAQASWQLRRFVPVVIALLLAYLTVGLPLAALPQYFTGPLGLGTALFSVAIALEFVTAILSRPWAGALADTKGGPAAMLGGCLLASVAAISYGLSPMLLAQGLPPLWSAAILMLGRVVLGLGASLLTAGALGWGVTQAGPGAAGRVMVWVGMAIYGAMALGAPLGGLLADHGGLPALGVATLVLPGLAFLLLKALPSPVPPVTQVRQAAPAMAFATVLGGIWLPGLGLACASMGLGSLMAFGALLYQHQGWGNGSLAFSLFGAAFILARLGFGHLPDRVGGARVAGVSIAVEGAGLACLGLADQAWVAAAGALLLGAGYSMAFPGFGVEAVRRAPPGARATAMAAYVAFLDMALAVALPVLGWIIQGGSPGRAFLLSGLLVAGGLPVAGYLGRSRR